MHRDLWRWSSPLRATVLAVTLLLTGCVSVAVTETTNTTVAPTTSTLEVRSDALPLWDGRRSGEVRTDTFQPSFSFVAPDGWKRDCPESPILVDMVPPDMAPLTSTMGVWAHDFETVEETVAHLMESPADHSTREPTSVGGAGGVTFDSIPNTDYTIFEAPGSCIFSMAAGEGWRFWVVDVNGKIVTFAIFAPSAQLDEVATLARTILDSVVWG